MKLRAFTATIPLPASPLKGEEINSLPFQGEETNSLPLKGEETNSLPFKGRGGEGMGYVFHVKTASEGRPALRLRWRYGVILSSDPPETVGQYVAKTRCHDRLYQAFQTGILLLVANE
ncbi:MAG: hypothetical protein Q8O31_01750 [Rhodocyclaceae bacterium]|nr:hypothetical protein [Rhodocyclaceae bacterium]